MKEIDLQQRDTLVFKGEHAENEHWRLVEDRYGQVGYAPAAFLVVILDTTAEEDESDAILSGILPVCGNRIQGYRNSKRVAVNGMVERLCKEDDVGYVGQLCGE